MAFLSLLPIGIDDRAEMPYSKNTKRHKQMQEKKYFMKFIEEKGALIFFPEGHIDSNNASSFEKELMQALNDHPGREPVLDAEKLKYISSAGLRDFCLSRGRRGTRI